MTYHYTQPEFDAFGWSTMSNSDLSPANGAYMLIEVFQVDDDFNPDDCFPTAPYGTPAYNSIADCFGEN